MAFYLAVSAVSIAACFLWGDWRNWKKYQATTLYFMVGDFFCNFLIYNKPLWSYTAKGLNHTIIDAFIAVTVYPCTIMMFIPKYPQKLHKQVIHILLWAFIYSTVEYVAYLLGYFVYSNGWNTFYSIIFSTVMFLILRLHYTSPSLAYGLSLIAILILLSYFYISVSVMR